MARVITEEGWVVVRRTKKVGDGPDTNIAIGKRSELIAASYFISKGCHVYYQVMEQGPVDLVVLDKSGEWHYFDVKTVSRRKDESIISRTLTDLQRQIGVQLVYVDLKTGEVHKYPHQFSRVTPPQFSERNAGNRRFNGEIPAKLDEVIKNS